MFNASDEMTVHWTRQLYLEYDAINWYHRANLRVPVVQIANLGKRWGQWDPFFRSITLNVKLITSYSWDVVLEILKHEMAHQFVTEVLKVEGDTAHGENYKLACRVLGVADWAAKASGELPDKIPTLRERVLSEDDERLLSRVEKLLALAQSANEHEAVLAMQRVQELYAKHNIDRLRASRSGSMDSLVICRKRKKKEPHESKIYSLLNEHFFVKVVHSSLYDPVENTKFATAELLGTRENLLMAEYVFYFLLRQCESLWLSHKKATRCEGRFRRSYLLGVLHGFGEKLASQEVQAKAASDMGLSHSQSKALISLGKNELNDFVELRFPRLVSRSTGRGRVDGSLFAAGQSAGKSINIHRGVSSRTGFGGYLGG